MTLLFEPWNLGDALIAASVARLAPGRFSLACNSSWHEVLRLASHDSLSLLPLDLPYVWRSGKKFFSLGDAAGLGAGLCRENPRLEIISIRGDLRDWLAARRIFPGGVFRFTGWRPFLARKLSLFDHPFASGELPLRNRYRAWAEAAGIPFRTLERSYSHRTAPLTHAPIVIHLGAQWRSKQYPQVAELAELLRTRGDQVIILAGPQDPLPPGISAAEVQRPSWPGLVAQLRGAQRVVTNDSGPMHLAAFLGCRTLALSRCSNIAEWLPPGVTPLSSPAAPRGYRPIPEYWSDRILTDWPTPVAVAAALPEGRP